MNQSVTLVPLDGSQAAESALPYALTVAGLLGTGLRLLRVIEPFEDAPWGITASARDRAEQQHRSEAERYLQEVASQRRDAGLEIAPEVVAGEPADSILKAAALPDVTVVTMATHGRGGVQRLLLGSVANKVLRLGTRPLLLVRTAEPAGARRPGVLKRILLPLDGSELAEQAISLAQQLAQAAGATLVLARAERHLWQYPAGDIPMTDLGLVDEEVTQSIAGYLEGVRSKLSATLRVELQWSRGYPAVVLEDLVANGNIDLVVMATHGRGGARRLAIGSMANRMVRLGTPTLLVRSALVGESV